MTKVAIMPEKSAEGDLAYRAIAGARQSVARTAGGTLDALTAQLTEDEKGTLVIVQNQSADAIFTAAQQQRLAELMARWRDARDAGGTLPVVAQAELDALAEAEVRASADRAAAVLRELGQ